MLESSALKTDFASFVYERPNLEVFTQEFTAALSQLEGAISAADQLQAIAQINALRNTFDTQTTLAMVRHSIDTSDPFYEAEQVFLDQELPALQALTTRYYQLLVDSPFRAALQAQLGTQLWDIAACQLRTFHPDIVPDLQEENRLSTAYTKILASAQITFRDEELSLAAVEKFEVSTDRELRREAYRARWGFYEENAPELEQLFDDLVKVRTRMARKLGYDNFVGLAYDRMLRTDYTPDKVAVFRRQIQEYIVPLAQEVLERQRQRLGLEHLCVFDEAVRFLSGNPKPDGDAAWIAEQTRRMYSELSPETGTFFDFMQEQGLMDLSSKPNKAPGGYCTYFPAYQAPFIFSNFNGTSSDVYVMTHECGHAFQVFSSPHQPIIEYLWPTYDACEIHSMSMEFFTWPWMNLFFGEDADKYRYNHLIDVICFLPYGTAVDEFQHFVYEHPEASPADRRAYWQELETRYLPQRNYDGVPVLESGGFWIKQRHIFNSPFYYIDYVLAQTCALQYWTRDQENHAAAWASYLELCRAGGSASFLELVALADLRSPFEEGSMTKVVTEISRYLDRVDEKVF